MEDTERGGGVDREGVTPTTTATKIRFLPPLPPIYFNVYCLPLVQLMLGE